MKNKNEILVDGVTYLVNPETKEATLLQASAKQTRKDDVTGMFKVPDEVDGYKVTAIEREAFYDCKWIEEISFGKNIREIPEYAFPDCVNLRSIGFWAKNVEALPIIREKAFVRCENLRGIILYGFLHCNRTYYCYIARHSPKFSTPNNIEKEILAEFMSKCESGAFAGCWKVPVELEEH